MSLEPAQGVGAGNPNNIWEIENSYRDAAQSVYRSRLSLDSLGRCGKCQFLQCCVTAYGKIYARCPQMGLRINSNDPIVECTFFKDQNVRPISYYFAIGKEIDLEKKHAGF